MSDRVKSLFTSVRSRAVAAIVIGMIAVVSVLPEYRLQAAPVEIILDYGTAGVTETGSWMSATAATEHYGGMSRYAMAGGGVDTASFRPNLPEAGLYEVFAWNSCYNNRPTNVPHRIIHSAGTTVVAVDQSCITGSHGEWFSLGAYNFSAGTGGAVEITDQGLTPSSYTYIGSDAVRFYKQGGAVNTLPVISTATTSVSVTEGSLVSLQASASDAEDGNITSSIQWSNTLGNSGTGGTFSFTASTSTVVTVQVADSQGASDTETIAVNVVAAPPQNTAPAISTATSSVSVAQGSVVSLQATASDVEDGNITSNIQWSNTLGNVGSGGGFSFTASTSTVVTIQITDSGGLTDTETVTVTVTPPPPTNTLPVISTATTSVSVTEGSLVSLQASASDAEDGNITSSIQWSNTLGNSGTGGTFSFTASTSTVVSLMVSDGQGGTDTETVSVTAVQAPPPVVPDFADSFDCGVEPLGSNYVTNNPSAIPVAGKKCGRYYAEVTDNTNDKTLHYNNRQGRLDARLATFPFEAVARNIGIGTIADSQVAPDPAGEPYLFAGLQVHVTDLDSRNSSHFVMGHRGLGKFVVEGKNTVDAVSTVDAQLTNSTLGRVDMRIVGNADRTLTVYWQLPNPNPGAQADNWQPYAGTGRLPGPTPAYGSQVYVGLITYAAGTQGLPFVGTADSFQIDMQ